MNQDEVHRLLTRAEEIQGQGLAPLGDEVDVNQLVKAAEEAGLEKEAVLQALRERVDQTSNPLAPDTPVFAKTDSGFFYPAKVVSQTGTDVSVKFTNGATSKVDRLDLRPFVPTPGQVLTCPRGHSGWWDCTVKDYDPEKMMVYCTQPTGDTKWYYFEDMRMNPVGVTNPPYVNIKARVWQWALVLGSGLIGALLMRLFAH